MPRLTPLPEELGPAFAYAHARGLGVSPQRLRARDLGHPHRGVRLARFVDPEPEDSAPGARDRRSRRELMHRIDGYERVRPRHAFYVGRTALGIYRLPFTDAGRALCVGVFSPARPPRMNGVDGFAISPSLTSVREHDGLPVASPASVWAMLARELGERELTILADAIVRVPREEQGRRRPDEQLATIDQLRAAALAPHRRHRDTLMRALARARIGCMSVLESEYRLAAEDAGLPEPELDVKIRDDRGRLIGIADAVHRPHRVIVEIEGDQHRTSRAQWNRDLEKHAAYTAAGWEVVRVTSEHIRVSGRAVSLVRDALARRGTPTS